MPQDGADLFLELNENERIHDNCPIRYDDGRNPFLEVDEYQFYYANADRNFMNSFLLFLTLVLNFFNF